jgi:hypothetical protein
MPVSSIPNPMAVLAGAVAMVAVTIAAHAITNKPVVYGCPGVRYKSPSLTARRRNTNNPAAVNPNRMKSTDTT